jgi:hypothetical protein
MTATTARQPTWDAGLSLKLPGAHPPIAVPPACKSRLEFEGPVETRNSAGTVVTGAGSRSFRNGFELSQKIAERRGGTDHQNH